MIRNSMEKDTGMVLFGVAVLAFMGFLIWRMSSSTGNTGLTSFTRDDQGRIIEILEKELK